MYTPHQHKTYRVVATKKHTGERVEGTTRWDGLASLHPVTTAADETKWVSELDDIAVFELVNEQ